MRGAALRISCNGGHGNKSVAPLSGAAQLGLRVDAKNFEKRVRARRMRLGKDFAHPRMDPPNELR